MRERCPRCGTRLDRGGVCPGDYELTVMRNGERYADAAQLVHRLSRVTMTWVRNQSRADRGDVLESVKVGRKVYFSYARAVRVERDMRPDEECPLDSVLVSA